MFVRLTRTQRRRAGWFVALVYLFCVQAPTLSFALPGSQATPHCLTPDHVSGMVHVHHESVMHVHEDGRAHHHSGVQADAASPADDDAGPAKAPHMSDGKCCGLMCVTALPAIDVSVTKRSAPKAIRMSESFRTLRDNAPPRLYRPPIS